jgi:hypothetical protein
MWLRLFIPHVQQIEIKPWKPANLIQKRQLMFSSDEIKLIFGRPSSISNVLEGAFDFKKGGISRGK